jgi:hypothetical protein
MPGKPRTVLFRYRGEEYTVEWHGCDLAPADASWWVFGIYDENGEEVTVLDFCGSVVAREPDEIPDDWLTEAAREILAEPGEA